MSEFLAMGGYGWFLWPAYGVTFIALLANIALARSAHTQALRDARRRLETSEGDQT